MHNTGIQRCVRVIARALIDAGECLTLLVWDGVVDILLPAGAAAREHLARWCVAAEWMLHTVIDDYFKSELSPRLPAMSMHVFQVLI